MYGGGLHRAPGGYAWGALQPPDALDRLEQAIIRRGQRDAEEALAAAAICAARRDHDGGLLEDVLAIGGRALEPRWDRSPGVHGALRRGDVDARLVQRRADEIAPALVD